MSQTPLLLSADGAMKFKREEEEEEGEVEGEGRRKTRKGRKKKRRRRSFVSLLRNSNQHNVSLRLASRGRQSGATPLSPRNLPRPV